MTLQFSKEPWGPRSQGDEEAATHLHYGLGPVVVADHTSEVRLTGLRGFLPLRSWQPTTSGSTLCLFDLPLSSSKAHRVFAVDHTGRNWFADYILQDAQIRPQGLPQTLPGSTDQDVAEDRLLSFVGSAIGLFDEIRLNAEFCAGRKIPVSVSLSKKNDALEPDSWSRFVMVLV